MIRQTILLAVAAVSVAACPGSAGERRDPEPSTGDEFTLPPKPAKSLAPIERTVTGVLTFDDIEGGCVFLQALDGSRYEIVYPEGWLVDRRAAQLRGPAGEVVAAGGTVTVRGSVARDRGSICQVGQIFVASTVEPQPSPR